MKKEKPKKTFYTVLGMIGDCLFVPIMLLALIVCMFIFMERRHGEPPSIFGISIVRILSGSMTASGFNVNDNVIVKQCAPDQVWEGDIIAFYSRYDDADIKMYNYKQFTKLESPDQQIYVPQVPIVYEGRTTVDDAKARGVRIVFHQVIAVYVDGNGTRFFETKGTSNESRDLYPAREDFLVGKYVETPVAVRNAFKWVCSPIGMIALVCLPLGILVIMQSLSLIEQINFIVIEKKLLAKTIDYKDPEAMRLFKSGEMEEVAKILYLSKTKEEERDDVYSLLWNTESKNKIAKKQDYYNKIEQGFEILKNKGKKDYLLYWKNNLKSKKEIKKIDDQLSILILQNVTNSQKNQPKEN